MSIIIWAIILLAVCIFAGGIRIIRPTEKGIVERLGKYNRIANPGFNWIIPVIDRMIEINTTEQMMDVEPQDIITKDNLNARVDLQVYYKVRNDEISLKKSVYDVRNFERQITALAQTTARNEIGDMNFAAVNSNRNELNNKLKVTLDKQSDAWGVAVVRVEMKEITPPKDVQESMNRVIKAQNEKDAANDLATAAETKADGLRRAAIKEAEGERQAKILKAEGEAKAFDLINKSFVGNAQLLKQYEVLQASLQNNTKIVLTEKGISPNIIMDAIPIKRK